MSGTHQDMPDMTLPFDLRFRLHLGRAWPAYTVAGVASMPAAIEAGLTYAGLAGYTAAVLALQHAPKDLARRVIPAGPARGIALVVVANILLRSSW